MLPLALEAAICALCVKEPGEALPGVLTPALGLPYPTVHPQPPLNKTLLVNGGSSAVGSMIAQLAIAIGLDVVLISAHTSITSSLPSERITEFLTSRDSTNVEDIISHITQSNNKFIGIFDAISIPSTYELDLKILKALGGGQLACTHPPPKDLPKDVAAGMIFAVNDVVTPVWREFVTPALETGMLKCILTPTVIGKGLEFVQEELDMLKSGVHDTKLVVEL